MSNISNLEDFRTPTPSTKNSKVTNTPQYKDVRNCEYLTSLQMNKIHQQSIQVNQSPWSSSQHYHHDCLRSRFSQTERLAHQTRKHLSEWEGPSIGF